jgi:SH3-like domain-containing protein
MPAKRNPRNGIPPHEVEAALMITIPMPRHPRSLAMRIAAAFLSLMILAGLAALPVLSASPVAAQTSIGPETRLPIPRYVSLKTDRVNLREGPSTDHSTRWVYQRAGLPVEIIAEFDNWRRIRDPEGADGWVWHSLLSGRRTAIVAPWERESGLVVQMRAEAHDDARVVARLEPGVVASVSRCTDGWCRLAVADGPRREIAGFVAQDMLWGVYPDETID